LENVLRVTDHVANAFKAIDEATAKADPGEKNPNPLPAIHRSQFYDRI